jgi:hypothetical protein
MKDEKVLIFEPTTKPEGPKILLFNASIDAVGHRKRLGVPIRALNVIIKMFSRSFSSLELLIDRPEISTYHLPTLAVHLAQPSGMMC